MNGRVVHFEIPFSDGDRARGFYRAGIRLECHGTAGYGVHDGGFRPDDGPGYAPENPVSSTAGCCSAAPAR